MARSTLISLSDHLARIKALQDALIAGELSGPPQPFDNEAFLKRMRERCGYPSSPQRGEVPSKARR
ncbi:type II toxin-antitoxin system ParD family antitoxin [Neorhizobium galegae]|nr:type II toxin-antitoxin system ParD family antitoxin [Neorhizobium galegae]UIK06426.1 type II toxin-antitoxin system ParD family antitoxin [Neorhizobium galegae]